MAVGEFWLLSIMVTEFFSEIFSKFCIICLINFTILRVQDANDLTNAFVVRRIYLEDDAKKENTQLPEYRVGIHRIIYPLAKIRVLIWKSCHHHIQILNP